MLDFNEVGRRIDARAGCDCGQCDVPSHVEIVSPLIGQLLDPEYHGEKGTILHTAGECINLGQLLEKQALMLDEREAQLAQAQQGNPMQQMMVQAHISHLTQTIEQLQRKLARITLGTVVVALWLSSIVVSVWLSH
jgi:hypothetical protein